MSERLDLRDYSPDGLILRFLSDYDARDNESLDRSHEELRRRLFVAWAAEKPKRETEARKI